MEHKTKGILFSVLVVAGTAVVFFFLGFITSFIYGPAHIVTTQIEYVEPSEPLDPDEIPGVAGFEKVDLNTATVEQLMTVPGIGKTYAQRIVTYREEVGLFTQLEQLQEVDGIGEKRYLQWLPYLTISQNDRLEE